MSPCSNDAREDGSYPDHQHPTNIQIFQKSQTVYIGIGCILNFSCQQIKASYARGSSISGIKTLHFEGLSKIVISIKKFAKIYC